MLLNLEVKTLGDKIRLVRMSKRWSQCDLATLARTTQGTISRIERNMPIDSIEKQKILTALDVND